MTPSIDLPMLDEDDKRTILDEWNDTAVAFPDEKRLHRLFEAQVRRTPDAVGSSTATNASPTPSSTPAPTSLAHRLRGSASAPGRLSACAWSGARISSPPCSPS